MKTYPFSLYLVWIAKVEIIYLECSSKHTLNTKFQALQKIKYPSKINTSKY